MEWIGVCAFLILAVLLSSLRSPGSIGRRGELKLKSKIDSQLNDGTYHAFHDVVLPSPDGSTQIDHVLISRYGIFVIETKNMKGWIFGGERERVWTQVLFRRRHTFLNPLRQNYKHLKAVEAALGINPKRLHSVVVFTGRAQFKTPMPDNVMGVQDFVGYVRSQTLVEFNDSDVLAAVLKFEKSAISVPDANRFHLQNLYRNRENPSCPVCGKKMTLRTARRGSQIGSQFWGCTGYPGCKRTKHVA